MKTYSYAEAQKHKKKIEQLKRNLRENANKMLELCKELDEMYIYDKDATHEELSSTAWNDLTFEQALNSQSVGGAIMYMNNKSDAMKNVANNVRDLVKDKL